MILKALIDYYEILREQGIVAEPGWAEVKLSYALQISLEGELVGCRDLTKTIHRASKQHRVPIEKVMPAPVKRSGPTFCPNFLYDNSAYVLGIDAKGDPERSEACFREAGRYYRRVLKSVDLPECRALLRYYETWNPRGTGEHPILKAYLKDILKGSNLTFVVGDRFLHEIPAFREAWDSVYADDRDLEWIVNLVTNTNAPIVAIHPGIRGIAGAQPMGAALVSFNEPSACSHGKVQGFNAPLSRNNAFAYTAALNYLASDREHLYRIGKLTLFHWAKNGEDAYQDFVQAFFFGKGSEYSHAELADLAERIISNGSVRAFGSWLSYDMPYTFLMLSPNAARLSVQLFQQDTFGNFLRGMLSWHRAMEIADHSRSSIFQMLMAGTKEYGRENGDNPVVVSQILRAILTGQPVPAVLYNSVQTRISTQRDITPVQAAVVKAYHQLKPSGVSGESLTEYLNTECKSHAYLLGRLFAVLEQIQYRAKPGQSPLRRMWFCTASRNPAAIFPELVKVAERQIQSLGRAGHYYRQDLKKLSGAFQTGYPTNLDSDEKAEFQLGYYHQRSAAYSAARAFTKEVAAHV